jgi:hypothetical protein
MFQLQSVPTAQKSFHREQTVERFVKKESPRDKWATFTYLGKETHFIIKISRYDNIKIVCKANNTIRINRAFRILKRVNI